VNKTLKFSYIILGIGLIACVVVYFIIPLPVNWPKDIALNIGANIIGIFLVVILINAVLDFKQERERKRCQSIAFRQLRTPLHRHFTMLFNMLKASVIAKPDKSYSQVSDFFDGDYFKKIKYLDFSKDSPTSTAYVRYNWFTYLALRCVEFQKSLDRTIAKYISYLDIDIIDLMEEISNSHFVYFVSQAPEILKFDQQKGLNRPYNLFAGEGIIDFVKDYTSLFSKLISYYNQTVSKGEQIKITENLWRNDVEPLIGSGRIESQQLNN